MNQSQVDLSLAKLNVLVVDDSLSVRVDLRRALGAAGFNVTVCEDVATARRALTRGAYSLAILDVVLPDGDGVDLLHEIKAGAGTKGMPVILMSTEVEVHDRVRGVAQGADDYIGKPYDVSYLIQRIRRLSVVRDSLGPPSCWRGVGGQRVLVVDDSLTFGSALAAQLRMDRHEVVVARSGEEALKFLEVEAVDCIVTDFSMSGIDGLEMCRRIKRMPGRSDIPILMVTSCTDALVRSMSRTIGVDDYLIKDPNMEQVRARVRKLLRARLLERCQECHPTGGPTSERGSDGAALEEAVIRTIGLPTRVSAALLESARRRAGTAEEPLSAAGLRHILPLLREGLSAFLCSEEAARRIDTMQRITRHTLPAARH